MEIKVGKNAGFCYGVENAVSKAEKILENTNMVYCLGEIIHNGEVVRELEEKGLKIIDKIEDASDRVIIRAHGISKDVYQKAQELNIQILDYTCPNVLRIHELAEDYKNKGYFIFLIGVKVHPETIGTISFCGNNSYVIETGTDIENAIMKLKKSNINNLAILVQTTFSLEKFNIYLEEINEKLKDIRNNIKIENTICNATKIRQNEAKEISKIVQKMIVVGGKNSSNTKKLFENSKENCKNTYIVDTKDELNLTDFNKNDKIGVVAGASTPRKTIDEIVDYLKNIK